MLKQYNNLVRFIIHKCDKSSSNHRSRRGHDRMLVGFTTTYAISVYHH